jgi:hypothetical protein
MTDQSRAEFEEALVRFERTRMMLDAEWEHGTSEERAERRKELAYARRDCVALFDAKHAAVPIKGEAELADMLQREVFERMPDPQPGGVSLAVACARAVAARGIALDREKMKEYCRQFPIRFYDSEEHFIDALLRAGMGAE